MRTIKIDPVIDYSTYNEDTFEYAPVVLGKADKGDFAGNKDILWRGVKTLVCMKCGSDKFTVGSGVCLTIIKCPNCNWSQVIHEG